MDAKTPKESDDDLGQTRMLVAASSPWSSEKMVSSIKDSAKRLGAIVIVVHVVQASDEDESEDDARLRGEQTLSTLTDKLDEIGIPSERVLLISDDVPRAIINAAEEHDATLIVLGVSNKSKVSRWLMGDVPQKLIKNTKIPVLLLPPSWRGVI